MNSTPRANRTHIAIYGKTNAGKSSLLNAIIGQDISIVSDIKGTTTDPVSKAMELIPFGPVVFIDTAGLGDDSKLGEARIKRTKKILQRTDFALYIIDASDFDRKNLAEMLKEFKKYNINHMIIFNKIDLLDEFTLNNLRNEFEKCIFISSHNSKDILNLKDKLIKQLETGQQEPPIVGDLVPYNGKVVLVVPIDSEAPKGRLILPQVQLLRDCLDHGIKSYVVRDTELKNALEDLNDIDLVVTDSQAFKAVDNIVPNNIKLTSFSILFARYKGDLEKLVSGVKILDNLSDGAKILIAESCTHNVSHEDIGRVKIPKMLNQKYKKNFDFTFKMGHDFPENLSEYDLVIHCGSCMLNKKTMDTRIQFCENKNVPITNYGIVISEVTGILDRTIEIFNL